MNLKELETMLNEMAETLVLRYHQQRNTGETIDYVLEIKKMCKISDIGIKPEENCNDCYGFVLSGSDGKSFFRTVKVGKNKFNQRDYSEAYLSIAHHLKIKTTNKWDVVKWVAR